MKRRRVFVVGLASAAWLGATLSAQAQNTADATLELTITLTGVTITDAIGNTTQALFETSSEAGDLRFEDIGPNGSTFTGESPNNPPGSVGTASASETVLLNGLDPFDDNVDINQDSFGIGDSLVSTMTASASAQTPGSVFFGQVESESVLFFSVFGDETDRYTFHFDYSAVLTGSLDSSALPGATLAFGDGDEVSGSADTTVAGPPNDFVVEADFFHLGMFNGGNTLVPLNEMASGSFDVAFNPGDDGLSITFRSGLVVNAGVEEVPEPTSLALLMLATSLPLAIRRRD
jgi:hypothetical protein